MNSTGDSKTSQQKSDLLRALTQVARQSQKDLKANSNEYEILVTPETRAVKNGNTI